MLKETVESYLGREINIKIKTRMNKTFWKVCAVALLIILYLLALNDRYFIYNGVVIDKWAEEFIYVGDENTGWIDWDRTK